MVWCSNTCRGLSSTPARRARETTWMERMQSPPSAKKLSSTPTRSARSTSAQTRASTSSAGVRGATYCSRRRVLRRGERLAVQLAVGRQRQRVHRHERGGHHVLRQPRRRCARSALRRPHRPPRTPPAACRPARPRARRRRTRARRRASSSAASISPSSMRKPRIFTCSSRRPRNSSVPSARQRTRSPVRYSAPRRRTGSGTKRSRRQRRAVQVAARHAAAAHVQLARHAHGHAAAAARPARTAAGPGCARRWGCRRRSNTSSRDSGRYVTWTVVSVMPVHVHQPRRIHAAPLHPLAQARRLQRLAAEDHVAQGQLARPRSASARMSWRKARGRLVQHRHALAPHAARGRRPGRGSRDTGRRRSRPPYSSAPQISHTETSNAHGVEAASTRRSAPKPNHASVAAEQAQPRCGARSARPWAAPWIRRCR